MKLRVFIGSSVEGKSLAEAIQSNLDHDAYCTVGRRVFSALVATALTPSLMVCARTTSASSFYLLMTSQQSGQTSFAWCGQCPA